jgi:primosomal protein N' (replication factor Y) (superfamily II helicase)
VSAAIAQVEPLTTTRALRGPFDYRLSEELRREVDVGSLLVVPFGRRQLIGVVVGLAERSEVPSEKLLAPCHATALGIPAELVGLAAWLAQAYCSTPARALGLMLPVGATSGARPRRRMVAELTPGGRALISGEESAPLTARQLALLRTLADGAVPASTVAGGHAALRRLAARGLVRVGTRELPRRPRHIAVGPRSARPLPLTPDQQRAISALTGALHERRAAEILLHGVTGSGKTELYLRAAAAALAQGRGAIVLVPEIALTPQMLGRFVERLGDTVAVLHSRLTVGERYDEWRRLRARQARVCVGPRSAVFAPIEDLGLIVVDEEHDASYKHEGDPRYDARAVAAQRASSSGALLLLGSATPRPESYVSGAQLRLPHRVDRRPLPAVRVLDMRSTASGLHPETLHALAEVRHQGAKAIVLLNRRGWSSFCSCRLCGTVWMCPHCEVSLVLHRGEARMSCHHCGHAELVPARCHCGSRSLARHGMGTERLQHELASLLGGVGRRFPTFRLDADVAGTGTRGDAAQAPTAARRTHGVGRRETVADVLSRFERAPAGVLVGTQMVAKGHDFPGVSLGVVLDADASLAFPDFRAEERTFALIAQLAGRIGRGTAGRVLVQTIAPGSRAIRYAARHDSEGFLATEIARRQALRYPPFSSLIRIVCSAPDGAPAARAASALSERLRAELASEQVQVLGPAALFRLRGRERRALLLKTGRCAVTVRAVGAAVRRAAAAREHSGVSFSVDVDPQ